jgi:FKBP-type peptidyl-prolyl cis-trans isomerase
MTMVLALVAVWLWVLRFVFAGSNEEGLKFLEENKSKPGVITLESGLQYKVLTEGTGSFHPSVNSPCLCHYEGKLIDGTVFDSSYERGEPITFAPNQVIKGWTEAMQLMVEGKKQR